LAALASAERRLNKVQTMSGDKVINIVGRLEAKREAGRACASSSASYAAHGKIMVPAVNQLRELGLSSVEIAKTLRLVADLLDGNKSLEPGASLLERLNASDDERQCRTQPS
jgi:hypothetical protein